VQIILQIIGPLNHGYPGLERTQDLAKDSGLIEDAPKSLTGDPTLSH
jgi:hypothetical protein